MTELMMSGTPKAKRKGRKPKTEKLTSNELLESSTELLNNLDNLSENIDLPSGLLGIEANSKFIEKNFKSKQNDTAIKQEILSTDEKSIESGYESNAQIVFNIEQLREYNYKTWAPSILRRLQKAKLIGYVQDEPDPDQSNDLTIDKIISDSILNTVSSESKLKITEHSYTSTKQLWIIIKKLFYDVFVCLKEFNLKYITRSNCKSICAVESHVNQFKKSVVELIAVDFKFNQFILINMFYNTLENAIPLFHKMIRQHTEMQNTNFTETLQFAATQASYIIKFQQSDELDNDDESISS